MLRTEGRGFGPRLRQGLSLAGSSWSDIIGLSLRGRGGGLGNLRSPHYKAPRAPGVTAVRLEDAAWRRRVTLRDRKILLGPPGTRCMRWI